jgi:predicted ATPase
MIQKLRLHNFRTFLDSELEFRPRHLIIGKNNSGKSNLCSALRFLAATASTSLSEAAGNWIPGGIREMGNWAYSGSVTEISIHCVLPFQGHELVYEYELDLRQELADKPSGPGVLSLRISKEKLTVTEEVKKKATLIESDGHQATLMHEGQIEISEKPYMPKTLAPADATMLSKLYELDTNPRAILFRRFLTGILYYAFSPFQIRREFGKTSNLIPGPHGEGLASALFHLKNRDEERYRRILDSLQAVEPGLKYINFLVAPDQGILPFVGVKDRSEASWQGLSDGTLRALGLNYLIELAALLEAVQGAAPPLMLIEEPENGIYGGLLRRLLEDFDDRAPRSQFIFTSHSPLFIDMFDNDRSQVTSLRRENERTMAQALSKKDFVENPDERTTLAEDYFAEVLD